MDVYGIDFTSRPNSRKPITCLHCTLERETLSARDLEELPDFAAFEQVLQRPGPWIAGIDFPFGQSRKFIEGVCWPQEDWEAYVRHVGSLDRDGFRKVLTEYKRYRPKGDKEHRRQTDIAAGSVSPQKLYRPPVGLMFYEGAKRLLASGVTIPHVHSGDCERIAVEAYPGVLARNLIGPRSYKSDAKKGHTSERRGARLDILCSLTSGRPAGPPGFAVVADPALADDPSGDSLDSLLCAIQAAWAWCNRTECYGAPASIDCLEGWISDASAWLK